MESRFLALIQMGGLNSSETSSLKTTDDYNHVWKTNCHKQAYSFLYDSSIVAEIANKLDAEGNLLYNKLTIGNVEAEYSIQGKVLYLLETQSPGCFSHREWRVNGWLSTVMHHLVVYFKLSRTFARWFVCERGGFRYLPLINRGISLTCHELSPHYSDLQTVWR